MNKTKPTTMICLAGFGDDGSMYHPLLTTELASQVNIILFDLPGFGKPPATGETTLERLADAVDAEVRKTGAEVVLAHSVASIIASLAAGKNGSPIRTIMSLEGNLTAEDAYFSGTAADYDVPASFRTAFLSRLKTMAKDDPIVARYLAVVTEADPNALWQLGCDARRFSQQHIPGEVLMASSHAVYLYNPANLAESSLDWLNRHDIARIQLNGASHWPTIDQPQQLADALLKAINESGFFNI